jgi:hypothetical protein
MEIKRSWRPTANATIEISDSDLGMLATILTDHKTMISNAEKREFLSCFLVDIEELYKKEQAIKGCKNCNKLRK